MASESEIEKAFRSGDRDDDDGLSVSEAGDALKELSGKSIDASAIEQACGSCGITLGHEMSFDEFKSLVKHLEESGSL